MDYQKVMDEDFNYPDFYNEIMKEIGYRIDLEKEVMEKLEEKRKFGLNKYGEYSFQASFKNSMTSPSEEHLEEELIDAINYILHNLFKTRAKFLSSELYGKEIRIAKDLVSLYYSVVEFNKIKYENS